MSTFKVEVTRISSLISHPNADKLELVTLEGKDWQCVVAKDFYHVGDKVIYFPIDSILPPEVETVIFPIGSKVKLTNSRVKTIKLRGAISQGLVVRPSLLNLKDYEVNTDITSLLKVTKYEPPVKLSSQSNPFPVRKKQLHPDFKKYTGIENAKNYNNVFAEDEQVSVTEKIHGTNFRAGYLPYNVNTFWKKIKNFFRLSPKYEFVYGSHNVQLQDKLLYTGFYDKNVYAEAVINYRLRELLSPNEVIYGEIYGDGIQKGYTYGCKPGERRLVLFDVMINGKWLNTDYFRTWAEEKGLPVVPELYRGPFKKDKIIQIRDGDSILNSSQKVREGIVVKPLKEETTFIGRKILKFISDAYLLKNQDDETEAH